MKFTWDEKKRKANLIKHGLDFTLAERIFGALDVVDVLDTRCDYSEERHLAYGTVNNKRLCMCYVVREDEIRVISIRGVHDREWRKHYGCEIL